MAEAVYLLCALTSIGCSALLLRGWLKSRSQLLFWSSLCFAGLAVNNVLLFVDLVVVPTALDLSLIRSLLAVIAVGTMVFGLDWESR